MWLWVDRYLDEYKRCCVHETDYWVYETTRADLIGLTGIRDHVAVDVGDERNSDDNDDDDNNDDDE